MAIYTRQQLRDGVTGSVNISTTAARRMTLINNTQTTAYFVIEGSQYFDPSSSYGGVAYRQIFNSASLRNLVSCSMVTESMHAAFIVNPLTSASFEFVKNASPTSIPGSHLVFSAPNSLVYSVTNNAVTASLFGIEASGSLI
jgi:hypothetical protein